MRLVVSSQSARECEQLRQVVLSLGLECAVDDCLVHNQIASRLLRADVKLVLLAASLDTGLTLTAIHSCNARSTPVFVVVDDAVMNELPRFLRAGALGYIRYAEMRDDLFAAVQQAKAYVNTSVSLGQVLAITGAVPGVGVTTVATNLAFVLAERHPHRVALAQMSDGVSDLALNLMLCPTYSLAEISAGWHRLDSTLMRHCLVNHPAGVAVLADHAKSASPVSWQPSAMRQLLLLLRGHFEFVVLDLGHTLDSAREEAARMADSVGVVQRLDGPGLQIGRERLLQLREVGVAAERLLSIPNRVGQGQQLPWQIAQEMLALPLCDGIPDDPAGTNLALNLGRPVVQNARTAPIAQSFVKLAGRWNGQVDLHRSRAPLAEAS